MTAHCLRLTFAKGERARFLSHLDLQATLEYGMRRARLPLALTQGFNPRPRMSIVAPLPLGYTGEHEILEIWLDEPLPPDEVARRLNDALPPDIIVHAAQVVSDGGKGAASRLRGAIYRAILPSTPADLEARVGMLLQQETLPIEEVRDDATRVRDIRPFITTLQCLDDSVVRIEVRMTGEGSVRPDEIVKLLHVPLDGARFVREELLLADALP